MKLCVTGGAGYIGSVVAQSLLDAGHDVIIIDNLSTGHRDAVPAGARLIEGDIREPSVLDEAFKLKPEAVLHFAALSVVSDSVERALEYYDNNVLGTLSLLLAMNQAGIDRFVFSSSAAVYGEPDSLPIEESAPCRPSNPYGQTKYFVERILDHYHRHTGLKYVALRYFNAGGSTEAHGEHHEPESHLIPVLLDVVAGKREKFVIFGDDYDSDDGTCIRDYIHVVDLAAAHVLALDAMGCGFSGPLNLGSDTPFTVLGVVEAVERVTGKTVYREFGPRRPGDPPALLASSAKAQSVLGWRKAHSSLEEIIRSAHEWRLRHPNGYAR